MWLQIFASVLTASIALTLCAVFLQDTKFYDRWWNPGVRRRN
jgi:hypothetical protein